LFRSLEVALKSPTMEFVPAIAAQESPWEEDEDGISISPVLGIHRSRLVLLKATSTGLEVQFRKQLLRKFLLHLISLQSDCIDTNDGTRPTKCRCMNALTRFQESEAVNCVEYLYGFGLLTKSEQQTLVMEWMKYADFITKAYRRGDILKKTCYLLPGTPYLICKDAMCRLLGLGKDAWRTIRKLVKDNATPSHGLIGRLGNKFNKGMDDMLKDYFAEVVKLAQPRATLVIRHLVRNQVQTELREDDDDIVELPAHMSKRSLYDRMLAELGWKYIYDGRSRIIERQEIEGMEQQQSPSWSTFLSYWSKHHPKLFVAGAREDVCNQCYIFANRHRYAAKKKQDDELHAIAGDDLIGPSVEEPQPNEEEEEDTMVRGEELVKTAARHVEMAQVQRCLYQQKRQEAIATRERPPSERVLCFVADYAQNMYIPNFAGEQPGATYYYSPLSLYVFGVVDASKDCLSAWMYGEDIAKKGGNNVASLLMKHLEHHDIATTAEPFKELNFIMDNCGGQNKNRQVLRLLHFIVKKKIASVARAIFLVRGHTKNACDRLFNTMKKQYRKTNCFTPDDLVQGMAGLPNVEPILVNDDVFKDWDVLEDMHIRNIPSGNTNKNHIFTVDITKNDGNSMFAKQCDGNDEDEVEFKMVKPKYTAAVYDTAFWKALQPEVIPAVGLQDIKWKELYHKWGKYVPEDIKPQWRYYSEAPPKVLIDKVAKQSKEARQQRKERTRTVHNEKQPAKKPKTDSDNDNKEDGSKSGAI
jgi:hypothetical protein